MPDRVPLDTGSANAELIRLYEDAWPRLQQAREGYSGASGIHLPMIPDGYGGLPVRLAVVGQESKGWNAAETAREQAALYPDDGHVRARQGTPFWRAAREVADGLNECEDAPVLWANLVAVDTGGRPPTELRDSVREAVPPTGLLPRVLEAASPDAVVFFVGPDPYYAWELEQQFPGVRREAVDGCDERVLSRVVHPDLPTASFRSYHPRKLNYGDWNTVSDLARLIRQALQY